MLSNSTRRWLAGLGVAGAFVAASATPALAEKSQVKLGWYFNDSTVATGTAGKVEDGIIYASAPVLLHDLTVRYDFSDLAGKIDVTAYEDTIGECTSPSKHVLLCTSMWEVGVEEWGLAGIFPVQLTPTDTAKDGDSGKLKMTVSAAGIDAIAHESTVRVGEGVDLAAGAPTELSLAPGKSFTAPLSVTNAGGTTAKGATVVFYNDYGLNAGKRFSNCTYVGNELRTCQFKEDLPAGTTFSATLPYVLGADSFAPGLKYGEVVWMTPAEFEDFQRYINHFEATIGKPGTDGELTLAEASAKMSKAVQADTQPDNNSSHLAVKVTGKNSTDLEALGATLTGKVGDLVKATVGVRNNGPATLDYNRAGSSITYMALDVPKGTTAVEVPQSCAPVNGDKWGEPGEPGARHYRCYFDPFLKAGDTATRDFTLRIDKVIANATGIVKINVPCQCDGGFYRDLKPANDTAKLVVNPAAGGGNDGGQGGGDGGTLPITGSSTGLIAGIGALLLAAGAGGYVIARRRKTRFVA
ncbi:LPXTG cell wall anchor domain-containing protein [Micromonospora narathiwatensis]|uniref:LPXTG-motif cell wall anchor domain-containing protein n=1 Tax=Micromonospora narathiwatensis TaxID=299146 RepID=A0A1A9ABV7_9ACTN|nr:LPXTG cell wall anchor domain-containing protein [Micromonospora narathiwatensis]SBT53682.1 LPXTG-motif cell wall anchor domain-containing protein [Micromonospora narathiwatensis]